MQLVARRLDVVGRQIAQRLPAGAIENDPAVVAAQAAPADPGYLAQCAQLVQQARLVAGDPGRQNVALQNGGRDRETRQLIDDLRQALQRSFSAERGRLP